MLFVTTEAEELSDFPVLIYAHTKVWTSLFHYILGSRVTSINSEHIPPEASKHSQ